MLERYGICLLLGLYIILGNVYGAVTPIMEASDELWHYPMVKYIADRWALPIQEPGAETPWRQEGSQPPLYYLFGAVFTSWIDTFDLAQVRRINPHADNGIIRADGNTNLIVHSSGERFPWHGTSLAIHVLRFLSVCMGTGTVYLTYALVLELWPERRGLALAAAAITAFNPMFCFISGSVNNDNLAMLLGAAGIWLLMRLVKRYAVAQPASHSAWWRDVLVLGVVLGLAMLTKPSIAGLLFLTALAVGYVAWQRHSWWHFFSGGFVTAGLVIAIAGWWFVRNAVLYDGDWTGIERFIAILGYRDPPATLRQLWGERHGFMMAYWGLFGGVNVPMPGWVYTVLNGASLISVVGLIAGLAAKVSGFRSRATSILRSVVDPRGWGLEPGTVQLALLVLWPIAVVVPWIIWATRTWSSQGRLVFTSMSAWSTWMALGLSQFWPRLERDERPRLVRPQTPALRAGASVPRPPDRASHPEGAADVPRPDVLAGGRCSGGDERLRHWSSALPGALGMFMFGVAVWAPWGVVAPAYRPPVLPTDVEPRPEHVLRADVGGQLRLLGYDLGNATARPGEPFRFTLYWEAQGEMDRDWSIFCHILDREIELPVATRDRYPGQGLLATSSMAPGFRWADRYEVDLAETTYAPADAVLEIGLYDVKSDERPPIVVEVGDGVDVVGNALRFQPLRIKPRAGDVPNPISVNFQDEMALTGWDVDRRVVAPGETVHLTLYWECTGRISRDYSVFAQVLDKGGQKWAQWDSWPANTATSSWRVGQRFQDHYDLVLNPETPAGAKTLVIGVYHNDPSSRLERLRIINSAGRILPEDELILDRIRVTR